MKTELLAGLLLAAGGLEVGPVPAVIDSAVKDCFASLKSDLVSCPSVKAYQLSPGTSVLDSVAKLEEELKLKLKSSNRWEESKVLVGRLANNTRTLFDNADAGDYEKYAQSTASIVQSFSNIASERTSLVYTDADASGIPSLDLITEVVINTEHHVAYVFQIAPPKASE